MEININRGVEDTFYRYKMPKLAAKVEGKGNGIKTVIVNVSDIAKALHRKPIYLTKFFGCELGAQIHVDEKNERYIVNGAHEATKLQELLDGFIKKFVLCQGCGNPETVMYANKKACTVSTVCKACGSEGQLDVTHRLTQFIVKNPPENEVPTAKGRSRKSKKGKGEAEKNSDEDNDGNAGGGDENSRSSPAHNGANDDDDDWVEDTTEEAQLQRMNELSAMAKSLALSVSADKPETERADIFYRHLTQMYQHNSIINSRREIKQEADRLNLGARAVLVLAEVLLNSPGTIVSDVKKYAPVFVQFTRFGDEQGRSQLYMLGAMAKLIDRHSDKNLLAKACHILKALYDCDIVEEEVILAWHDKGPSRKFVSRELSAKILDVCHPMVKWLREAEEEDSEDSEEEVQKNSPNQANEPVVTKSESPVKLDPQKPQNGANDDDDEIDIDAI